MGVRDDFHMVPMGSNTSSHIGSPHGCPVRPLHSHSCCMAPRKARECPAKGPRNSNTSSGSDWLVVAGGVVSSDPHQKRPSVATILASCWCAVPRCKARTQRPWRSESLDENSRAAPPLRAGMVCHRTCKDPLPVFQWRCARQRVEDWAPGCVTRTLPPEVYRC